MKTSYQRTVMAMLLAAATVAAPASAQSGRNAGAAQEAPAGEQKPELKKKDRRERFATDGAAQGEGPEKAAADKQDAARQAADEERQRLRREQPSEAEAAVMPYINNFFETVRLGPEDVIAVDVFEQPKYSRGNITIPPDGRVSYPLIGQVKVVGRTTTDVEREITEKLSEYIIEPKVTVQLVASHSQKVFVVGDVGQPGMYEMTRRMTVTEALARAGYILRTGDKQGVRVLRMQANGQMLPHPINIKEVEKGKGQDLFLVPGDTVVVPGNKFKKIREIMEMVSLGAWMRTIAR